MSSKKNRNEGSEKKRRKVVRQKGKLLAEWREKRLQMLKRMAEKTTEASDCHTPVFI